MNGDRINDAFNGVPIIIREESSWEFWKKLSEATKSFRGREFGIGIDIAVEGREAFTGCVRALPDYEI